MGAEQSSNRADDSVGATVAKTCYYELLEIDRHATDDEIKRAYRRKALELHPDRNYGDVENATRKFAEIRSAYEVLSDPQERAWYDSHRDAILNGQEIGGDGVEPATYRNVRLTSTEEILSLMRKFNSTVPFTDEPTGFYGIVRETFEHLALEEEAAAEFDRVDVPDYPTFGSSDDDYESTVKQFYSIWTSFTTKKSFSWKDKYRLSDAPDRRVRRFMEKENKKLRDDAAREFNDAVRFLVTFVRKRDPRYTPNSQTDAERQASLRNAAAAQAARSRAAHQEKLSSYEAPEWARSRSDDSQIEDEFAESEEQSEVEVLECIVCNKSFKSDKQLEAHERSKKHVKAVQQLRRQMQREGAGLDLGETAPTSFVAMEDRRDDSAEQPARSDSGSESNDASTSQVKSSETLQPRSKVHEISPAIDGSPNESEDGDYAPRHIVEDRLTVDQRPAHGASPNVEHGLPVTIDDLAIDEPQQTKRVGKAKAKRERKAAARAQEDESHRCSVCGDVYASRTKLFNHIRDERHTAPVAKQVASEKKRR